MRVTIPLLIAAVGFASPVWADANRQLCDATAAKSPNDTAKRIAKAAIDEFHLFDGHRVDANGRLFYFGLTEAEHEEDDGGDRPTNVGKLGWWRVMAYWRATFPGEDASSKIEVRGYKDASSSQQNSDEAAVLRSSAAELMKAAESAEPDIRETLREAALRGAILDTPWSAAFISYVVRQAGVTPAAFVFSNAHRSYIYDAFATSEAEAKNAGSDRIYRACPLDTTPVRAGDMICQQREPSLANASDAEARERVRSELNGPASARTVRRTHCDIVAHVDAGARKVYVIGGNVSQSVTAKKLNLRSNLRFSVAQKGRCGNGQWTLPSAGKSSADEKCSLNDKKWFVLLQVR